MNELLNFTNTNQPGIIKNKYGLLKLDSNYFLEFSSKEEYLIKRKEWRNLYKLLSNELRHNKITWKWICRKYSTPKKLIVFPDPFPELKRSFNFINPTKFLELRHEQKRLSAIQRELNL